MEYKIYRGYTPHLGECLGISVICKNSLRRDFENHLIIPNIEIYDPWLTYIKNKDFDLMMKMNNQNETQAVEERTLGELKQRTRFYQNKQILKGEASFSTVIPVEYEILDKSKFIELMTKYYKINQEFVNKILYNITINTCSKEFRDKVISIIRKFKKEIHSISHAKKQ